MGASASGTHPSRDDFARWETQVHNTGYCTNPIRLHGRIDAVDLATGEMRPVYHTDHEPGGVLLTACGNRRESVCPPCSQTYKRDARQLVRAGLTGGKGIPETIAVHPCVFATFTAPSFGPVHSRRKRGKTILPCRPRRDAAQRRCPHGRDISCPVRHHEADPRLGKPLCPDCYDYTSAVLFNACAGELWRRFTTYLPRHLARLAAITQRQLREHVAIRYVKVAEYQARGAVHFHAVIRLDTPGQNYQPPASPFTAELLADAIRDAAAAVRLAVEPDTEHPDRPASTLGFGDQCLPKIIRRSTELPATGQALTVQAVANYIAKYATKTLNAPGLPDHRIRTALDLDRLSCSEHYQRLITTAWRLGRQGACGEPLRKWAHMLGFGGHFLTKSRRYSVTFGQLRTDRRDHRRAQHHPDGERDPWGRPLDDTVVLILKTWTVTGTGYRTDAETELALSAAARAREHDEWPVTTT
ncbi:MAG TPA: replication initiator, partial [Streptosporangiaceae bacterium]|nr:replication initiator [Streptosporangiaceae bacterium]